MTALPGARRYLQATGYAGLKRAIVSASANTLAMLELAGLATLVEELADARVIRAEKLRSRPAPDLLLAACRRLGVSRRRMSSRLLQPRPGWPPAMRPGS